MSRSERIAQYLWLTRGRFLTTTQAADLMGVSLPTASGYERDVTARTGESARQARRRRFFELRNDGLTIAAAAAEVGVCEWTGKDWSRNRYQRQREAS